MPTNPETLQARVTTALNNLGYQLDPVEVADGEAALWDVYGPRKELIGRVGDFDKCRNAAALLREVLDLSQTLSLCVELVKENVLSISDDAEAAFEAGLFRGLVTTPEQIATVWLRVVGGGERER